MRIIPTNDRFKSALKKVSIAFMKSIEIDQIAGKKLKVMLLSLISPPSRNMDYSLSYFKGFDDIPIPVDIDPSTRLAVMGFPEMQVRGFDFAGEFRFVGFWGELALFFPDEIRIGPTVLLSDEPFFKYTFGTDYTFRNEVYLQAQFVHGFFTERGKGNLNDFLIRKVEKKFLKNERTLTLGGGLEVKDLGDIDDNCGTALIPDVSYRPLDNVELTLGWYLFGGKNGTLL